MRVNTKYRNIYAEEFYNYDKIPKHIFAAIAGSIISRIIPILDDDEMTDVEGYLFREWDNLYMTGCLDYRPTKRQSKK